MDRDELLALFDRYHNAVYRLALSFTRSVPDAEDITQDVFLKLLDRAPMLQPGSEKAYLMQMCVNACRDLRRSAWHSRRAELCDDIAFNQPEESGLFEAVMALPQKLRIAVHLHYGEGYSGAEIAELLHCSPSAVSMRLHRARKLLRQKLEEDSHESTVSENL